MKPPPRFPPVKKRPDGTFGCRGCGGNIPPNRKTWCGHDCHEKFDPFYVRQAVRKRAGDKCESCSRDLSRAALRKHREKMPRSPSYAECGLPWPYDCKKLFKHPLHLEFKKLLQEWKKLLPAGEYDHIIPHSEGGPFTLENIRLLCHACHVKRTTEWRRSKKSKKTENV